MRIAASAVVVFRGLLALLAVLYFTIALAILGLRYVVLPNIDRYLPDIERLASQVLDTPVRIDSLAADWQRLHPELRLAGVRLLDEDGEPALRLPRVDVLLSWQSLLTWQPELLRLQLHGPVLDAGRDAEGRVSVAGLPLASTGAQTRLAEHPALHWLLRQRSIEIHDATLNWSDAVTGPAALSLHKVDAVLRYSILGGTRFALQARLPESMGRKIDVRGEVQRNLLGLSGVPGAPQWQGRLYAALDDVELAALRPWLRDEAPQASGRMALRGWLAFQDGVVGAWSGDIVSRDVALPALAPEVGARWGGARIALRGDAVKRSAQAELHLEQGVLALPGLFERGDIPVRRLDTAVKVDYPAGEAPVWRFERTRADAGEAGAQLTLSADAIWRPVGASVAGTIDLVGRVEQADVGAVARFMPLAVGEHARRWLDDGLVAGRLEAVDVRLAGDLADFPFEDAPPEAATFHVAGQVRQGRIDIAPHVAQRWPVFEEINGSVRVERATLSAKVERAVVRQGMPGPVVLNSVAVDIPHLDDDAVLTVQGEAAAAAQTLLAYVRATPLAEITEGVLQTATASGDWTVPLKVVAPLDDIDQLSVAGAVRLGNGSFRLQPGAPEFTRLSGVVEFTDRQIGANRVKGVLLGGSFDAHGATGRDGGEIALRGRLTLPALQAWWPAPGMRHIAGATDYAGSLRWDRSGTTLQLRSELAGLATHLPAPLNKPAGASWPLRMRLSQAADGGGRHLDLELADRAALVMDWSAGDAGRPAAIGRAALGVGRPAVLPASGWRADIRAPRLDLDAWDATLNEFLKEDARSPEPGKEPPAPAHPVSISLDVDALHMLGLSLERARLDAGHSGDGHWQARIDSPQAAGRLRWFDSPEREAGVENVVGRFSTLTLQLADPGGEAPGPAQPRAVTDIPDIDLQVDALRLNDWDLGALSLLGSHVGPLQWRLNRLLLVNPDVRVQATGEWQARRDQPDDRRVTLHTQWQIADFGNLLDRLGMPGVVAGGKGDIKGTIGWRGKPFSYDLPSLEGHLGVALDNGRFLQASSTAGRLLGILSLQSLARTATFQGGNLFESGFAWDSIRSEVSIDKGVAEILSFSMNGPSATAVLSGRTSLLNRNQTLEAAIMPHVDASAAALLAGLTLNPVVGVGAFLGQWLLRQPLAEALAYRYVVKGSWSEPVIERVESRP